MIWRESLLAITLATSNLLPEFGSRLSFAVRSRAMQEPAYNDANSKQQEDEQGAGYLHRPIQESDLHYYNILDGKQYNQYDEANNENQAVIHRPPCR
jgi:hypothetical protein